MATPDSAATAKFLFSAFMSFATNRHPPTHTSLQHLQRKLNASATAVHSDDGSGLHCNLALTVTPPQYLQIAGATNLFPKPVAPPSMTDSLIAAAATTAQITRIEQEHRVQICIFHRYHKNDKALACSVMEITPYTYCKIQELCQLEIIN
jgi:hypothetical protein